MPNKEDVKAALEAISKKFDDEKIARSFKTFNRKLVMDLTDLDIGFQLTLQNGEVQSIDEGKFEEADIRITIDSETLIGMLNGTINVMTAFTARKFKVDGKMPDLMKLTKLF
ncbi:MAG: SCP2 sterol-binding domain-containing protein [Promethearchaeota archaeon]